METLEIIGTLIGVLYLYLEYRASIYLWIAGIVMPLVYIFVYADAGLYADMSINIYYVFAAIYGWGVWLWGKRRRKALEQPAFMPITRTPLRMWGVLSIIALLLFFIMGEILSRYTDSTVPWIDSFTTALSIVGMWQLARKYLEQWLTWIVVDAVSAVLYVYKGLHFTAVLYALYTVVAIAGYFKWKKMMEETHHD